MENKKAIKILKLIREDFDGTGNVLADGRDAIDIAIKALELADCPQLQAECKACGGAFCDGEEETAT